MNGRMWIVRVALNRPYTFVVLALLILGIGPLTIARTPTDIFPNIDIPVVSVIWNYGGLSAQDMADRIISNFERTLTTAVNDIEHIESQSLRGISVVKVFLQPGAQIDLAVAQTTAVSQALLRQAPVGTVPPFIITYNASSVPIIQLALSGQGLSEQQLFDLGVNFIRPQLATFPARPFRGRTAASSRRSRWTSTPLRFRLGSWHLRMSSTRLHSRT
jgi:multidrug efflux pump subunit AcrB